METYHFGDLIREYRLTWRFTIVEAAARAGISVRSYHALESQAFPPDWKIVGKIAYAVMAYAENLYPREDLIHPELALLIISQGRYPERDWTPMTFKQRLRYWYLIYVVRRTRVIKWRTAEERENERRRREAMKERDLTVRERVEMVLVCLASFYAAGRIAAWLEEGRLVKWGLALIILIPYIVTLHRRFRAYEKRKF